MMFFRYVMSSWILMICAVSSFAQISQDIEQIYIQLPDSVKQSVHTFASRKYSMKNPNNAQTITNLRELLATVGQLSPYMQAQILRYTQKRHAALVVNKGGIVVTEIIQESKAKKLAKGRKEIIPDPY